MAQAKADYTANTRHALSVRYLYDNDDIIEDYELAENTALDFSDVSASWNWTLGQSMLNNATVQYMDQDTQRFQTTTETQVIRPSFTSGRSPNLPQGFPRQRYTFNDTFFWSTGRHSTKFGVRMAMEDLDYLADYYGAGVWQFNTDRAFNQADRDHLADSGSRWAAARRPGTTRTSSGASSPRTTCGWATSRSTSGCATTSTATCAAPT